MEHQTHETQARRDYFLPASILISVVILAGTFIYTAGLGASSLEAEKGQKAPPSLEEKVLPPEGVVLPAIWGDLGVKLVESGAIDPEKFRAIYATRGFTETHEKLLSGKNNGNLVITEENAGYILNLLWALGLASKNQILDSGEMADPAYGGAGNFASTAGWTVARGDAMDHYSRHSFFDLTDEEQNLVDRVSRGIYRPCCGNSAHFPDCNHGMAMLGLLELMASQGVSEADMWQAALAVNSYWFPETYLTIGTYLEERGIGWDRVDPREVLGADFSGISGYSRIVSEVKNLPESRGGSGCGVSAGDTPEVKRTARSSGCGI